jgi:4-alpha-glucanotransferase
VLPLGPTGYGDSPYQCFSALAGNPLLIAPERLAERGWLDPAELRKAPAFPEDAVDYGAVTAWKMPLLVRAAKRFLEGAAGAERREFDAFCAASAAWLDDFALFMALKQAHGGVIWTEWEDGARRREPAALSEWRGRLSRHVLVEKFLQFEFFSEWRALHGYCRSAGIRLMGDLPIYVAHDSADVWANPRFFDLDAGGNTAAVSGVPPDYFSATGQLWGNPVYRWEALAAEGYRWWLERFRATLELVDMVRLDHFRGFEAYWEIPAGEQTAVKGRWVKGPGIALFEALAPLGELPLVAENLGVITPEVEAIRERFGFPGMAVLQFAFGNDPQAPSFQPHNYPHNMVAYTGTHDCDTTVGWWTSEGKGESTRSEEDIRKERAFAKRYLNTDGCEINWVLLRALAASVADTVLAPLQDVLGLGSEARMNQPATISGNWRWRCRPGVLTPALAARLRELADLYGRRMIFS